MSTTTMADAATLRELAEGLSEEAKRDLIDGNCIMGSDICVCGSSIPVKGELAHFALAKFPADRDAGCIRTELGRLVADHLQSEGNS